jgi:cyanate permease
MAEFAGREMAGRVTGISSALVMLAVVAGPPTFGYIVDRTGSYQIAWQLLAVIAIIAAVSILFVRENRRRV